jgi:chromosome segregation ATPase
MVATYRDMPRFMNFPIADDSTSISARTASNTGFIESDIPLLEYFRILKKTQQGKVLNTDLAKSPQDVRDFLFWAMGTRGLPLPPIVRKVLCLKRATLKSGIGSINTSKKLRTGETEILAELDSILHMDGAKNPDDPETCAVEGSSFVTGSTTPSVQKKNITPPPGCVTHVHCDNAAVIELLTKIYASIQHLESSAPNKANLDQLKGLKNAVSVISAGTGDPGAIASQTAEKAANAATTGETETLKRSLNTLQSELSLISGLSKQSHEDIRTLLLTIGRSTQPVDAKLTEILSQLNRIEQRPETDLGPLMTAIERLPAGAGPAGEIRAAAAGLPAAVAADNTEEIRTLLAELRTLSGAQGTEFSAVREAINGLYTRLDPRITAIEGGLTALQAQVGNVAAVQTAINNLTTQLRETPDNVAQIQTRLQTLETAVNNLVRPEGEIASMRVTLAAIERLVMDTVVRREDLAAMLTEIQQSLAVAVQTIGQRPGQFETVIAGLYRDIPGMLGQALAPITGALDSLTTDTAGIAENVDTVKTNMRSTRTSVEALTEEIAQLRQELGGMRTNMGRGQTNISLQLRGIAENITRLEQLCGATRCPQEAFQSILDALRASTGTIIQQIGTLQRTNEGGRNSGIIADREALIQQIAQLQANVQAQAAQITANDEELAALRRQVQEKETELAGLRARTGRNTGMVGNLQQQVAARNAREAQLTTELEGLRARIVGLEDTAAQEQAASQSTLTQLRAERELLEAAIAEKDTTIAELRSQLAQGETSVSQIQQRLDAKAAEAASLERQITDGAAAETAALRNQLEEAQATIRGLRLSLTRLDDIERIAQERAEFERLANECRESQTALQRELDGLRESSRRNRESAASELEAARTKLTQRNAYYTQLLQERQTQLASDCDDRMNNLQAEHEAEIAEQIAKATNVDIGNQEKIKKLEGELAAQRRDFDQRIRTAVGEKDTQIASLTQRIQTVQRERNNASTAAQGIEISVRRVQLEFEDRIRTLQEEKDELERTLVAKDAEIAELIRARESDAALLSGVKAHGLKLDTIIKKQKQEFNDEQASLKADRNMTIGERNDTIAELRAKLQTDAQKSAQKNATISDLEATRSRLMSELERAGDWLGENKHLREEVDRFYQLHHQSELGRHGAEKRLKEAQAERNAFHAQLEAAGQKNSEIARIAAQLKTTQGQLDTLTEEYQRLLADCDKKAADLAAAKGSSSTSTESINRLTRELEAAQARLIAMSGAAPASKSAAAAAPQRPLISSAAAAAVEEPVLLPIQFRETLVNLRTKLGDGLRHIYGGRTPSDSAVDQKIREMVFDVLNKLMAAHPRRGVEAPSPDYDAWRAQLGYIYKDSHFKDAPSRTITDKGQVFTFDPSKMYSERLIQLFAIKLLEYIMSIKSAPMRLQPRSGASAAAEQDNNSESKLVVGAPQYIRNPRGFGAPTPLWKPSQPAAPGKLNNYTRRYGKHGRKNISKRKTRKLRK